jgi:hypothetical protein
LLVLSWASGYVTSGQVNSSPAEERQDLQAFQRRRRAEIVAWTMRLRARCLTTFALARARVAST